jgi:hypothetical protein
MPPTPMCGKHDIRLMLRRIAKSGEVALACPYCDMEELGGGKAERSLIDNALREKEKPPH